MSVVKASPYLLSMAVLTACSVPDLGTRPAPLTAARVATAGLSGDAIRWPDDDWWTAFGDPQLTRLIDEALEQSPDLASATARLRSARALAQEAHAATLPTLEAGGTAGYAKQSYNLGIPPAFIPKGWQETGGIDIQASLDLDLWGRNRAVARAALSDAEASELELAQARLVLTTGIADAYAELIRLTAVRAVATETIDVRSNTERLVANRVRNGLDTQAELKLAVGAIPAARAELRATDEAIALAKNQLALLAGQGPGRGLAITDPAPIAARHGLPADVTTDLLSRRPDIRAARARIDAASARIKVARTAFYPSISIVGLIGMQALGFGNVLKGTSTYGNAAPAVSLPIFQGGAIAARYRGARATYDGAVADYDAAVLQAFRQVADVVTSRQALQGRLSDTQAALDASRQAFAVAQRRYRGGMSTYLDVLTAQGAVLQNQALTANLATRAFTLDVALVRALGGGFIPHSIISASSERSKDRLRG